MTLTLPIQDTPINSNIIVQDNFMPDDYCDYLIHEMTCEGTYFPWHWGQILSKDATCSDFRNWQFGHVFWLFGRENSAYCHLIQPIIDQINPEVLYSVKTNLTPWDQTQVVHGFHTDVTNFSGLTSVYYTDTNNGATVFRTTNEDGTDSVTEIESKRNRLVTFDNRIYHSGKTQNDAKFRIVLNINYFKHSIFYSNQSNQSNANS